MWLGLVVLALGVVLIVIDGTIVGVALPSIIKGLNLTLTAAEWVNALYSVVFAALLLTFGKAGDLFGTARLFRADIAVFVIGLVAAFRVRASVSKKPAVAVVGDSTAESAGYDEGGEWDLPVT